MFLSEIVLITRVPCVPQWWPPVQQGLVCSVRSPPSAGSGSGARRPAAHLSSYYSAVPGGHTAAHQPRSPLLHCTLTANSDQISVRISLIGKRKLSLSQH